MGRINSSTRLALLFFKYFLEMSFLFFLPLLLIQHFSTLQNVDAFNLTMQNDYVIVDVRTPEEFANGALPKAVNISVTSLDFPFEINKLDKEKPVMIYCKAGSRSARAAVAMKALGFDTIYELKGGYTAWQSAKN